LYLINIYAQADGTGTLAATDRLEKLVAEQAEEEVAAAIQTTDTVDAAPINENLFLDEDLEGLDEELNDLDLDDS
jgi:hypothetical protein